jgi:hypothetical protein
MSKSYRIRTQVGVDKSIKVQLDQDFEFLEILSLKILQSQIYTRPCSDYGVVIGRVSVNDGFGLPNCKVSIFIPLTDEDAVNPILSDLYPYRTLSDFNEDGYRYNLLPYRPSYSAHIPTGTFFTRKDVLTDTTLIQVFDKYYKYNAVTNSSGDFMIFGVPVGTQTIHLDVDLSDIGDFSLSPQDLIRMGRATESQVAGVNFKSSPNLANLPQIVTINKTIEVEPLWGQPEVCNLGITRTDFDLSSEADILIEPTSIFMGSIISANDTQFIKKGCKPKLKQGHLCDLVAGPGEILAIRQTIFQDEYGRPVLEQVDLDQGGQVIDDNGAWLLDLPMNLDYLITNEFGEQVLSDDPKKGIPTKAKYRFKIKWNQSPSLSETVRRGYFLVPNIKEHGHNPLESIQNNLSNIHASYAFSLDWNDYGNTGTTEGLQMIQDGIDCVDTFYPMIYNKVYTVSQMLDKFRKGVAARRMTGIKHILDSECQSENNRFPTNDAFYRWDFIYLLFLIAMFIFKPVIYALLVVSHVVAFLLRYILGPILGVIAGIILVIVYAVCWIVRVLSFGAVSCDSVGESFKYVKKIFDLWKNFAFIKVPNLPYPDCEMCSCKDGETLDWGGESNPANAITDEAVADSGIYSILTPYYNVNNYILPDEPLSIPLSTNFAGQSIATPPNPQSSTGMAPQMKRYTTSGGNDRKIFTTSLTEQERLNLFNVKAKYFDTPTTPTNPGGGVNRIKVRFGSDLNASSLPLTSLMPGTNCHLDNVLVLSLQPDQLSEFTPGKLVCFQDFEQSKDINLTGVINYNQFFTKSITGTSVYNGVSTLQITYANPNNPNIGVPVNYFISGESTNELYHKFPMDIEYFQVITAMTYNVFSGTCVSNPYSLRDRFLGNDMRFYQLRLESTWTDTYLRNPIDLTEEGSNQVIVFLVRGVDPNSVRNKCEYDLSMLFGHSSPNGSVVVSGDYKLNHPIKPGLQSIGHEVSAGSFQYDTPTYPGGSQPIYYNSFHFQPTIGGNAGFSAFTSDLPKYYSKLDSTTLTFQPESQIYCPTVQTFCLSSPLRLKTAIPSVFAGIYPTLNQMNGFQYEWQFALNACGGRDVYSSNSVSSLGTAGKFRGYLDNENVEGGSVMYYYYDEIYPNTPGCPDVDAKGIGSYYAPSYYNTSYSLNYNLTAGVNSRKIVMRSDRLPTSSTVSLNLSNSFPLHTNKKFSIFLLTDDGVPLPTEGIANNVPSSGNATLLDVSGETQNYTQRLFETFDCAGMVPLGCYYTNPAPNNTEIQVYTIDQNNDCSTAPSGTKYMQNGCYVWVTNPLVSLPKDLLLLTEWISRLQITFGACRDVWSHMFANNWINGTLYMFPFKQERYFTSPFADPPVPPNSPYSVYCTDVMYLHYTTNSFYYRSTPYNFANDSFIGLTAPVSLINTPFGGNKRNLLFPTTIMDLGPRTYYLQEIVMSDDYDGYVVNKLNPTTYSDVEEVLNLFIISRLVNESFLKQFFEPGGTSIYAYFSRGEAIPGINFIRMVDADYAQSISVASELGVAPFEAENYPSYPNQDPIFYNGADASDGVIGIFWSSNTQIRDFITPKRTIIDPTGNPLDICTFNYFKNFSQRVPFYQWDIKNNSSGDSIFGSQKNDWVSEDDVVGGTSFFSREYQNMDRVNQSSRYFRTNNINQSLFFKGYIFSVTPGTATTETDLSAQVSTWSLNPAPYDRAVTVGAPFHFYFGLKRGKSAWDRFARKWIGFENITED